MKALIIGRAQGNWDEAAAAKALTSFDAVIAINSVGVDYPEPIDHWVSFHALNFPHWVEQRRVKGYPECTSLWTAKYRGYERIRGKLLAPVREIIIEGGSSGFIAVNVALKLGATHVVLAGVPMDPTRGHYNETGEWKEGYHHRKIWEQSQAILMDRVRSMSGWTQSLLGAPSIGWLDNQESRASCATTALPI